jgi:hypothetical protein
MSCAVLYCGKVESFNGGIKFKKVDAYQRKLKVGPILDAEYIRHLPTHSAWTECIFYGCKEITEKTRHFKIKKPRLLSRYSNSLRDGQSGYQIPVRAKFSAPFQTDAGARPASYTMGTVSLPRW